MKELFMILAAACFILTGCSKSEVEEVNAKTPDAIKFSTTTSRATVNDLAALQAATGGFQVYGLTNGATSWYSSVDGNNNYKWNSSSWGWVNTTNYPEWPTTSTDYPMTFYAMYPSGVSITPAAPTRSVTIQTNLANQVDMLAAIGTANQKPADGTLQLTFDHILSKVNFGLSLGANKAATIKDITIKNAKKTGTFNYLLSTWTNQSGSESFNYFSRTADGTLAATNSSTVDGTKNMIFSIPSIAKVKNLILLPQTTAKWDLTLPISSTQAYVEILYRLNDHSDGENYIGFDHATEYLNKYPAAQAGDYVWGDYTDGLGTGGASQYNGGLFVKAAFPLEISWEQGKGYVYYICLGTADATNGYHPKDEPYYYDDKGDETTVPINGPDGKPIIDGGGEPITKGTIDFLIDVDLFTESGSTVLN